MASEPSFDDEDDEDDDDDVDDDDVFTVSTEVESSKGIKALRDSCQKESGCNQPLALAYSPLQWFVWTQESSLLPSQAFDRVKVVYRHPPPQH
eukprot:5606767-Amphidinium_carterae.1